MDFAILFAQKAPIPLHTVAALTAIVLGGVQLYLPKGTKLHKYLGYCWVSLMALVALSSFFIHEIKMFGHFSAIHGLSLFTLISLWLGIDAARKKKLKRHRRLMEAMYVLALLLTGGFTLLPGRVMHQVLFGG